MSDADEFRVETRPAVAGDTAYITGTWLKGFLSGSGLSGRMEHATYYELHRPIVERLLTTAAVTVAHPAGDPETILGFAVAEPGVIHWVYVRASFRGNGIARRLVAKAPYRFTHWTDMSASLVRRFRDLAYYPYGV